MIDLKKISVCTAVVCTALCVGAVALAAENQDMSDEILRYVTEAQMAQQNRVLEDRLKQAGIFNNPRLAKKVYGGVQGVQKAVDDEHDDVMSLHEKASEEEKENIKKQLKQNQLLGFTDFGEKPASVTRQMAEKPLEKTKQVAQRMQYMDATRINDGQEKDLHARANALFKETHGMTVEEYRQLEHEQLMSDMDQSVAPAELGENVRYRKKDVTVEKVNETTAVIRTDTNARTK